MALEIIVDPDPLPWMKVGGAVRIKITFGDRRGLALVLMKVEGALSLNGKDEILGQATQTTSHKPTLHFIIRATRDGVPNVVVSSPEGKFETFALNRSSGPPETYDDRTELESGRPPEEGQTQLFTLPPQEAPTQEMENAMPDEPDPTPASVEEERNWTMPILGAVAAVLVAVGGFAWWQTRDAPAPDEPLIVTEEPQDDGTPLKPETEPVAAEPPTKVGPQAKVQEPPPTAPTKVEPRSSAATTNPPATPVTTTTPTEPTNCTFLNGGRPKVGEKYVLLCAQGQFTATGTYTVDHFVWSDFEEYPVPK